MKPLRILLDATCINDRAPTGASRYVRTLVSALARHDSENRYFVFGFDAQPFEPLPDNFTYIRAKLHSVLGPFAREVGRRRFVSGFCRSDKIDLVHFILDMAPVRGVKVPVVFTLFDLARLSLSFKKTTGDSFRSRMRTRIRYNSAALADRIVTTSHSSKAAIESALRLSGEKIEVVGIPPEPLFGPGPPDRTLLSQYGLSGKSYVLFVGEFGRQKNEDGLIRAFLDGVKSGELPPSAALVLVGDRTALSPVARGLLAKAELAERIVLPGRIHDKILLQLYRGARCLCLPSFYEGYGLPVLEAMACGTPSIVSDRMSLPELAGDAGIIVNPKDERALSRALIKMMTDDELRASLSRAGKDRAAGQSLKSMAERHLSIYREVAEGAR